MTGLGGEDYSPEVETKLKNLDFVINPDYPGTISNWNSINQAGDVGGTGFKISTINIPGNTIDPGFGLPTFSIPEITIPDLTKQIKFDINIGSPSTNDDLVNPMLQSLRQYSDEDVIVLIGHSLGADSVLEVARKANVEIDLLVLIDPVGYVNTSSLPQTGINAPGMVISFSNGISNSDGMTPGFRSGLPEVPSNVKYLYNRWQTNSLFPFDYSSSGRLVSQASRSVDDDFKGKGPGGKDIASQSELNTTERYTPDAILDAQAYLAGAVDLNPLTTRDVEIRPDNPLTPGIDEKVIATVPARNPNYNTTTMQLHRDMPRNNQIEDELQAILEGLTPKPPVAQASITNPKPSYFEGDSIQLSSAGTSDPNPGDLQNLKYEWTVYDSAATGIAGGQIINLPNVPNPTFVPPDNDTYTVTLTVEDSSGLRSLPVSFSIVVNNVAPSMSPISGPTNWVRSFPAQYSTDFTDPGSADTHTIQWNFGDGIVTPWSVAFVTPPFSLIPVPNNANHTFKNTGTFALTATVRDDDGGSDSKSLNVNVKAAGLIPDPYSPGKTALAVGGTGMDDKIFVRRNESAGYVDVYMNGVFEGSFAPTGHVLVHAAEGDDFVEVDVRIVSPTIVWGDEGNDFLKADATLLGGPGNDTFVVPAGTNTIDGDDGADVILVEGSQINDMLDVFQTQLAGVDTTVVINTQFGSDPIQTSSNTVRNVELIKLDGLDGNDQLLLSGTGLIPFAAYGGFGNDWIDGSQPDIVTASAFITAYGEQGRDTIRGGAGFDQLFGGDDADLFFWDSVESFYRLDGGTGSDAVIVTGTFGSDCFQVAPDDFLSNQVRVTVNASGGTPLYGRILAADVEQVSLKGEAGDDLYEILPLTPTMVNLLDIDYGPSGNDVAVLKLPIEGAAISVSPTMSSASAQVNGLKEMIRFFNATTADTLRVEGGLGDDVVKVFPQVLATMSVVVDGGDGDDYISGAITAMGGAGDDILIGTAFGDILLGGLGNDSIEGLGGDDLLLGDAEGTGAGSVPITCEGDLTPSMTPVAISAYVAAGGNDTIKGGDGNDSLNGGYADDMIYGDAGNDLIGFLAFGSNPALPTAFDEPGADSIWGGTGADSIDGAAGNDEIYGDAGADVIRGDLDNDKIWGGEDADLIEGNTGADTIYGDAGADTIYGNAGNDSIWGGDDADLIEGNTGADTIHGDAGADTIFGNEDGDAIYGDAGNDSIFGNDGDDLIWGGADADQIAGGQGQDTAYGEAGTDLIYGNEGNDELSGGADSDTIYGGLGADVMFGDEGNDLMCGGPASTESVDPTLDGNDTMLGGSGNDAVFGDYGNDFVNGGEGNDNLWGNEGNDTLGVIEFRGALYQDYGADSMVGGVGDDFIAGSLDPQDGNDAMFGQDGNDTLWGGAGGDMIYGGEGEDILLGGTPETANTVHVPRDPKLQQDGNDTMLGGNGFDQVDGGNGNNLMDAGDDGIRETVLGGLGNDMAYNHMKTDPATYDILALDGGFNHKFHDGYLLEPPVPAADCEFVTWVIPTMYYTGYKELHTGDIVEHPPLKYRTSPNNGPNGPVKAPKPIKINTGKAAQKPVAKPAVTKTVKPFAGKVRTVGTLNGAKKIAAKS